MVSLYTVPKLQKAFCNNLFRWHSSVFLEKSYEKDYTITKRLKRRLTADQHGVATCGGIDASADCNGPETDCATPLKSQFTNPNIVECTNCLQVDCLLHVYFQSGFLTRFFKGQTSTGAKAIYPFALWHPPPPLFPPHSTSNPPRAKSKSLLQPGKQQCGVCSQAGKRLSCQRLHLKLRQRVGPGGARRHNGHPSRRLHQLEGRVHLQRGAHH